MGSLGSRRADSAERPFRSRFPLLARCLSCGVWRRLCLWCLILVLAAPTPGSADEVVDDTAAEETDGDPSDDGAPVRSVGEVTVTATRAERDVLDVAGNVTVLTREEIRRSGADTVAAATCR